MSEGPRPVDRASQTPLWEQVRQDLLRRAGSGEFGAEFPGELVIARRYGVSRHTVREALRRLRQAGMVTAERGRTSRLAGPTEINQPLGALYSLFASVQSAGHSQRSLVRVLDRRADGVIAERLGLEGSTPLVFLERLRLADERPLAIDRVWLPADVAGPLLDADFEHTALYIELRERCGIRLTGGSERIRAVVPTPAERHLLEIGEHGAALAIERLGVAGQRPLEWRHSLVRGDRFALSVDFAEQAGWSNPQLPGYAHKFVAQYSDRRV